MSDIFIKDNIDDLITSIESDKLELPKWVNSLENKYNINKINKTNNTIISETSDFNNTNNNNLSSTSDFNFDNNMKSESSDSLDSKNFSLSEKSNISPTSNEEVDYNTDLLSATSDNNLQMGGSDIFINNKESNFDKTLATSPDEINSLINMLTSDENEKRFNTETSLTETEDLENKLKAILALQSGGKKSDKKTAKKSHKNEHETKKKRKANPAILAFGDLCKHIAAKLGIPNGVPVKKIGGQVNRDMKEKEPGLDPIENAKKAKKLFDDNIEKYKKLMA